MEAEALKVLLLLEDSRTRTSSSGNAVGMLASIISVKAEESLKVVCTSFSKKASTSLPFAKCSFRVHLCMSESNMANLRKKVRAVVKKKRSFYGQADRKGGGVSPLGPDRKQM